jgi:hypothetical protein
MTVCTRVSGGKCFYLGFGPQGRGGPCPADQNQWKNLAQGWKYCIGMHQKHHEKMQ